MRLRRIITVVITLVALTQLTARASPYPELKKLYSNKQYFQLRDVLQGYQKDSSPDLLFYRGVVSNKFNQLHLSIQYLQAYLKKAEGGKDAAAMRESYQLLADNYLKTYQYRKAAAAYDTILNKFRGGLNEREIAGYENSSKLWKALGDVPAQTAQFNGESRIKTFKDRIGLTNLPVEVNGQSVSMIFDTGANLSVATTSYANKLGLKIIDATIDVTAITGNKVQAKLAVARAIKIGNVTAQNVVFLVFDDKALYISQVPFQINAIIGFPLISALREITFSRGGEVLIPAIPGNGDIQNMCLDDLHPLIEGEFRDRRLIFTFDTGANRSDLYPPFYKAFEEEIKANSPPRIDKTTGAGGSKEVTVYSVKNLDMKFADKAAHFPELKVQTEYTTDKSRYFYGNLGQDLIMQFETMTLNFKSMSITFK
jgi:tetratricopeptide (TPR) repeat protein